MTGFRPQIGGFMSRRLPWWAPRVPRIDGELSAEHRRLLDLELEGKVPPWTDEDMVALRRRVIARLRG